MNNIISLFQKEERNHDFRTTNICFFESWITKYQISHLNNINCLLLSDSSWLVLISTYISDDIGNIIILNKVKSFQNLSLSLAVMRKIYAYFFLFDQFSIFISKKSLNNFMTDSGVCVENVGNIEVFIRHN